jgi:3alpha(or 20beta)-hydroxysteroid dehydrogenase
MGREEIMGRLDGKVALVTGAARGMGEAEARALAAEGADVIVTDVSDEDDWTAAVADALEVSGPIDVLVNNAGIRVGGRADTMSTEDYLSVVSVNQLGTFLGMRAVVPAMRAARRGSIVNTASAMGATRGRPGSIAYAATKWAIRGMTRSAALDLWADGIRVNVIHPGLIETPMAPPAGRARARRGVPGGDRLDPDGPAGPAGRGGRPRRLLGLG